MSPAASNLPFADDEVRLAFSVIDRRASTLTAADRADLKELFTEFAEALALDDAERRESARRGIEEILSGAPSPWRVMEIPKGSDARSGYAERLGKRIREQRAAAGLTQEELAEKSGIAQSYLSRLEQSKHVPNILTLEKIARALRIPLGNLDESARSD